MIEKPSNSDGRYCHYNGIIEYDQKAKTVNTGSGYNRISLKNRHRHYRPSRLSTTGNATDGRAID